MDFNKLLKINLAFSIAAFLISAAAFNMSITRPTVQETEHQSIQTSGAPLTMEPKEPLDPDALEYIKRFADVAKSEKIKYGIPVSIKLAQGLLESDKGRSTLATKNNNHFGIKCFAKGCAPGHCTNHSDDHHKDFFRKYPTAWESYRAHSELLTNNRYKTLLQYGDDYKKWAYGLKKLGYATDPNYPEKLISYIELYKLNTI